MFKLSGHGWDHADSLAADRYAQRTGLNAKHSQQQMIERTEKRLKEATRLRRRKVQAGRRK